ncbi:hypothetical protein AnigIFM59636_007052 [Aspergillus niger]|nr:hypothetical protein AnigIFM59636_007052 [Aspergillus niger]
MAPPTRDEFDVAIICALTIEADAVEALFDETYDKLGQRYGKQRGDNNAYINGKIGQHNVVLCYLPGMGKGTAAAAAANLRVSYQYVKLALLVGVCGGVPFLLDKAEILLGDVIISDSVVEYDFGRQYPDGFRRKSEVKKTLGRPNLEIRAFLIALSGQRTLDEFQERTRQHLEILQTQPNRGWQHPGLEQDVLFESSFRHSHHLNNARRTCICLECSSNEGPVCHEALKEDCKTIGCLGNKIHRHRIEKGMSDPAIHIGKVASADTVMKSGKHRDKIAEAEDVIGFEMEGAGVWDNLPCIIIKGVCDYADSHKNKTWQAYSAGTAACCTKAFLEYWISSTKDLEQIHTVRSDNSNNGSPSSLFSRLKVEAVDSHDQVSLQTLFDPRKDSVGSTFLPRRILIEGRAGVGKTTLCKKIVHDYLYQGMWRNLFSMVLWIPLRRLKSTSNTTRTLNTVLYDLFFAHLPDGKVVAESLQRIMFDSSPGRKLLLILDGLDEVAEEWNSETPMYNLLLQLLNYQQVIVTSRPYAMSLGRGSFDLELEAVGFNSNQVQAYVRKTFAHNSQKAANIITFINKHEVIQGLVRIPIQIDAVCYSWDRNFMVDDEHKTMTSLYETLTLKLWQKDVFRLGQRETCSDLNEHATRGLTASQIQKLIPVEIDFIERLAFTGMLNGIAEFNAEHRHQIYESIIHQGLSLPNLPETVLQKISFLHSSDSTLMDSNRSYHFLHLTFQEFFAAQYFVRRWIRREQMACLDLASDIPKLSSTMPEVFLEKNKYISRFDIMWRFVAGLLERSQNAEGQSGALAGFFGQIEAKPRDILGPAHQRLVNHCMSEVIKETEVGNRSVMQRQMHNWARFAWKFDTLSLFAREREFPGRILEVLYQKEEGQYKSETILQAILSRDRLSTAFVEYLCAEAGLNKAAKVSSLNSRDSEGLILIAIEAMIPKLEGYHGVTFIEPLAGLLKTGTPQLLEHAIPYLQYDSLPLRRTITTALRGRTDLSHAATDALLRLIGTHRCFITREQVINVLLSQESLSPAAIQALRLQITSDDLSARYAAVRILAAQRIPDFNMLDAFLSLGDYASLVWRRAFVDIIQCNGSWETLVNRLQASPHLLSTALATIIDEKGFPLPSSMIEVLLSFVGHQNTDVRLRVAKCFAWQPSLPPKTADKILPLLEDDDLRTTFFAALTLHRQPMLSPECKGALRSSGSLIVHCVGKFVSTQSAVSDKEIVPLRQFLQEDYLASLILAEILCERLPVNMDAVAELLMQGHPRFIANYLRSRKVLLPPSVVNRILEYLDKRPENWKPQDYKAVTLLFLQSSLPIQTLQRLHPIMTIHHSYQNDGALRNDLYQNAGILRALGQQPDLPNEILVELLTRLENAYFEVAELDIILRKHGALLPGLSFRSWRKLYRTWLERSFKEHVSCCLVNDCFVLDTPEGITRIVFDKPQLRIFKRAIWKEQAELEVPHDARLNRIYGGWALLRLGRDPL